MKWHLSFFNVFVHGYMPSESHHLKSHLKRSSTVKNRKQYFVTKLLRQHRIICFHYILTSISITAHTKGLQPRLGLLHIMYLPKHRAALFTRACNNRTWRNGFKLKEDRFHLERNSLLWGWWGRVTHHPEKLQMPYPEVFEPGWIGFEEPGLVEKCPWSQQENL